MTNNSGNNNGITFLGCFELAMILVVIVGFINDAGFGLIMLLAFIVVNIILSFFRSDSSESCIDDDDDIEVNVTINVETKRTDRDEEVPAKESVVQAVDEAIILESKSQEPSAPTLTASIAPHAESSIADTTAAQASQYAASATGTVESETKTAASTSKTVASSTKTAPIVSKKPAASAPQIEINTKDEGRDNYQRDENHTDYYSR